MAKLTKSLTLYERDSEGKLIPQEVKLEVDKKDLEEFPELKDMTIIITPLPRGELKKIFNLAGTVNDEKPDTDKDSDGEVILKHCFEPKYTEEEMPFVKPHSVRSIVSTIFLESGIKLSGDGKKTDDEDEFGKN